MESNPRRVGGGALEEAYMRQVEADRLRSVRAARGRHRLRSALAAELEVHDADLLERLLDMGVTPDTAPAFEALPLVEVAWADGHIDTEERWRVLALATAFGLELGLPAHAQLELWLTTRPAPELFDAWYRFAERRGGSAAPPARARRVLEGAKEVAEAAGGLLGIGSVSRAEREAIARIRRALGKIPGNAH